MCAGARVHVYICVFKCVNLCARCTYTYAYYLYIYIYANCVHMYM